LTPPPPGSSGPLEAAALETDTRDKNKKGIWAINALSTEDNQQARDALNKLMGLPHRVYVYRTEVKGVTYYRIRVGFFKNYEDAAKVGNLLASKYQFPKPWIVMPGPEELAKYHP
jgi:septal ring-binding cell division protein DamX